MSILAILLVIVFALGNLLSGWATLYGFSKIDLQLGTLILTTNVIFALVVNAILLGEIPTLLELVGGLLVFGSIVLLSLSSNKTIV